MPKRPEIGPTVGKVTYIHGGVPRGEIPLQTMAQQQLDPMQTTAHDYARLNRTTLEQLEAGEHELSENGGYVFPPEGLRVRPGAPSVHVYYGLDVSSETDFTVQYEADGRDIWAPDQNPAPDQLPPVDFHAIVMLGLIVLIMTFLGIGIINLFPSTIFAEFLPRISLPR